MHGLCHACTKLSCLNVCAHLLTLYVKSVPADMLVFAWCIILGSNTMSVAGDLASYDGAEHPAHGQLTEPSNYMEIERDLTLLGLAGLEDPPREEVPLAVRDCQLAGIRVSFRLSCALWNSRYRHVMHGDSKATTS